MNDLTSQRLEYPAARRSQHVDMLHGFAVPDPYRWMEEIDSPEVQSWIDSENALLEAFLDRSPRRGEISDRVGALAAYETISVPIERGGRRFFLRHDPALDQAVLCVMETEPDAVARTILDTNAMSEEGTVAIAGFAPDATGSRLAYGLSEAGSDWQQWHILDVDTGEEFGEVLNWIKFTQPVWSKRRSGPEPGPGSGFESGLGLGFYYTRYSAPEDGEEFKQANRCQKVLFHRLGTSQAEDELIYERPEHPEWRFRPQLTDDESYLLLTVFRGTHRETGLIAQRLDDRGGEPFGVLLSFGAAYHVIGTDGSRLFLQTTQEAPRGRIVSFDLDLDLDLDPIGQGTDFDQPSFLSTWIEIVSEREDTLDRAVYAANRFVLAYLHDAGARLVVADRRGETIAQPQLAEIGAIVDLASVAESSSVYAVVEGFADPGTVIEIDTREGQSKSFHKAQTPFDSNAFVTERHFYESKDGTKIPVFVSRRRDVPDDGSAPVYLYGYGGFNLAMSPQFKLAHLAWMDLGGVFVQACLRGGGEYGRAWHAAGSCENRQNVFDDFMAAAEWLLKSGRATRDRLAIGGRSNGGLLVGACMTQRPDLFAAVLAAVGVLDMLRFHRFTVGAGWVSDYGSPDDPLLFPILRRYSPVHNIRPGWSYPATLVTTGDHDDRVYPAHSFKFAAALQHAQPMSEEPDGSSGDPPAPILIRVDRNAGHGLGKPRGKLVAEITDGWTFILDALERGSG
ncbi:S9 family peptidase [Candidatus Bipolaricaulota bacterium]|nr:S9 family peptidase [Candidatus Bipolaricaulota bacterium]